MKLNNIKNSFDQREIKPSDQAWERLADRLDEQEKSHSKPVIFWLSGIAAVLLVALLLTPFIQQEINGPQASDEMMVSEETQEQDSLASEQNPLKVEKIIAAPVGSKDQEGMAGMDVDQESQYQQSVANNRRGSHVSAEKSLVNKTTNSGVPQKPLGSAIASTNEISNTPISQDNKSNFNPEQVEADFLQAQRDREMIAKNSAIEAAALLTAEQEADRLLQQAFGQYKDEAATASSISPDQLLRETEWDIEAEQRNKVNNAIFDGLGRLKAEAYALIGKKE
ncbi:hypothetical protein [Nonlabens xiamenensis]|uniref:hypothetical protein n=1 Tax=Nonlabens xiamenensis TaxID=2341043 RepID=UPI000F608EB7|nr:hypothetical protein [Nonlabens xiamenensis]